MLRDRGLQFFHVNEEFPVSASHQLALITSLPFVHTARRYYRLNDRSEVFGLDARYSAPPGAGSSRDREDDRTRPFRGSKSRNKVSVGEPAEGSLETGPRDRSRERPGSARAQSEPPRPRASGDRVRATSRRARSRRPRPPARRDPRRKAAAWCRVGPRAATDKTVVARAGDDADTHAGRSPRKMVYRRRVFFRSKIFFRRKTKKKIKVNAGTYFRVRKIL